MKQFNYLDDVEILDEDLLFEMARLDKKDTGLPYDLWIDGMGKDRNNEHHSPRIKVEISEENRIPFEISDDPDIPESVKKNGYKTFPHIKEVKQYVKAYKKVFMAHYLRQINDKQALSLLNKIIDCTSANVKLDKMILGVPLKAHIEYEWSPTQYLYIIRVVDDDKKEVVEETQALDTYNLLKEVSKLQRGYDLEDEDVKEIKYGFDV